MNPNDTVRDPDTPEWQSPNTGVWLDVSKHFYGPAEARLKANGEIALWVTGPTGPYQSFTVEKWREILQTVTKAIADATPPPPNPPALPQREATL